MKITDVKSFPVWGGNRNFFFIKVETDAGIYGIGEGGITWRELAAAACVDHLKPLLIGEDPNRIEHLWQLMFRGGFFPAGRIACSAISAIDIALWDIRGKVLGVPVYDLLGGLVRNKVVCYPHIGGGSPEQLAENAMKTADQGWRFVRWGTPTEGDILEPSKAARETLKQCEAVRTAVGDDVEILIDVHTRLDPQHAIPLCRSLEQFHPYFIEDPLRSENVTTYHQMARHVSVPLAIGEQFATKWEFRELIEEELMQYARIDVCIVGGLTEARKVANWCETHYIDIAPHNPLGPVSTAACLHLDLATSNFGVQELPRQPGTILPEVFPVQVSFEDGHLLPPTSPGLGIDFNEEAALASYYQEGNSPRISRPDGTFTNW
ncbi:galactonate dehydratase [Candidatus Poribacteria bacterium]|jgi:galactonate dehydratase|nr:galactonate dehydratase [Candidatus Poribacteria bacterium]